MTSDFAFGQWKNEIGQALNQVLAPFASQTLIDTTLSSTQISGGKSLMAE
jgi:hypothetical protein